MGSNGPYSVEASGKRGYFVKGPFAHGAIVSVVDYVMATEMALICNMAHAEGRKSMEKDFEELLELAEYVVDRIGDSGPFGQMHALEKFRAWKKARGIE